MATIDVKRFHKLAKDEAKKRAEELAKSMEEKFSLVWKWEGDTIQFDAPKGAAKGTKGIVQVSEKDVHVQIDLPFMLRVLKGKIESKVNEKLDALL
jgi:putative polyhydroxyalkanoate system protein